VIKESCPGSVETMKLLTDSLEAERLELKASGPFSLDEVRAAKIFLRQALGSI
jgi:hypothetical protein